MFSDFVLKLEKKPKYFGGAFYVPKFKKFRSKSGFFLAKKLSSKQTNKLSS